MRLFFNKPLNHDHFDAVAEDLMLTLSEMGVSEELRAQVAAIATLLIDALSVFYRQQKSVWNELLTFAAICLAVSFAAIATTEIAPTETATVSLLGL